MIYILVGPDGAGKSTLAKLLSERTGFPIIKKDKPLPNEVETYFATYVEELHKVDNVIYDRYAYCEPIYARCMGDRPSAISMEQLGHLEMLLSGRAVIIHCTADIDDLWDRCTTRGEDYVDTVGKLLSIRQGYIDLLKSSSLPVLEYRIGTSMCKM